MEEQYEKKRLLQEGFPNWTRNDFRHFIQACETHGRDHPSSIVKEVVVMTGKQQEEVETYLAAFWERYE